LQGTRKAGKRLEKHRQKIEEYGSTMEKMGLTPVAARVYIYLLFNPENGTTFDDLVSYFKVSKSAVSNALKMLNSTGMVEYKTIGGQRKRFFFVNFEGMFSKENLTERFAIVANMLEDIRKSRNLRDSFAEELKNASLFYKMLLVEFPIIFERWKRTIEMNKEG
jgi:DNA-binding transcriptional regulator GbsR (MarR family)